MNVKKTLRVLSSPKLTIACLLGAMVLVFLGTLEQISLGIYAVQENYFKSWFLYWKPTVLSFCIPYFPGGYLLASLLFFNLLAACAVYFRLKRPKIGILFIHMGLCLFILGEVVSGLFSLESQMAIRVGEAVNYSEDMREVELVVMNTTAPIVSFSEKHLKPGKEMDLPALPFSLTTKVKYSNARLTIPDEKDGAFPVLATQGIGAKVHVEPMPLVTTDDEVNFAAAVVELKDGELSLGTWLLSNAITAPQGFLYRGRNYEISMRQKRYYYPFSMELTKFTHEVYPGTEIPKNFSSSVKLFRKDGGLDRQALITMNHPLRYQGITFFQASYGDKDTVSVFQVVDNPMRFLPYLSSGFVGMGLVFQFVVSLHRFRKKRRT